MPTYDYVCKKCEHRFEVFHSISAPPEKECPECGGGVERQIHGGAGLIFKGSGFYLTDYKNSASSPGSKGGETKAKDGKSAGDKGSSEKTSETTSADSKD